jgi:sugar fermentation stimulation protein A
VKIAPLTKAVLLRRYKRFLADVRLADGTELTVHVPNTGSLLGCIREGSDCYLLDHGAARRKYRFSLFMVRPDKQLVCVDTSYPNKLAHAAAISQDIPALAGFTEFATEVPYGKASRIDLLCRVHTDDMLRRCWVEVKATTLVEGRTAMFPDAVSLRGRRHLEELQKMVEQGDEAVQLFVIQRSDCDIFRPADHIDPKYGAELRRAAAAGVKVLAVSVDLSKHEINLGRPIPVEL